MTKEVMWDQQGGDVPRGKNGSFPYLGSCREVLVTVLKFIYR